MKKKVFSLMMMLLLAVTGFVRANELTVHDGTATNGYVPVYGFYADAYLKAEFVMPAAELTAMANGDITAMKFYASQSSVSWGAANFQVFMTEVANASISDFNGPGTVVYEGSLSISGGEMNVTFTTPYHYNGGNLLIGIYNTVTGTYVTCTWYGESVTGASVQGYNYSSLASVTGYQRNFLPKTTFTYTGGGGGGVGDQLHVKYMDGNEEVVDRLDLGVRPANAWMEPFDFTMYTEGATYTVNVLDFTPSDGMFTVAGEELPFQVVRNQDVALNMMTNGTEAGVIERQFVAITEGDRAAHIWPVTVELYAPEIPDVWEKACTEATRFPFVEVPATAHNTVLHNDYTLPFPEIEEGVDAVYKLVFDHDVMLNAEVTYGENGKVALYTADFNGEGGPMATNYYTGTEIMGGGGAAAPFEAMIGDETSTSYTAYMPFYTLYNYSISEALFTAAELSEAGVTTAPMGSLSWEAIDVTTTQTQENISIWMANVADTEVGTTSMVASNMTLVYTGSIPTVPPMGWNEFVFNQGSFAWDGASNVLILVQRNNGQWSGHVNWRSHNPGFYGMGYKYQDSTPYDAAAQAYDLTRSNTSRPNTLFKSAGRRTLPMLSTLTRNPGVNTNASLNRDGWMYYDNGTYATNVGAGGEVYWGTMFPASMITENKLTKVALYENDENVGNITLTVYSGGTTAPGTQIYTQSITPVGGDEFHEITLASPVTIDPSQNLWIVFHQVGDAYPACACDGSSYPNNRWVSLDGTAWYDLAEAGLPGYEWLIRAYLENNAPVPPTPPTPPTPTPGEVSYSAGPVIEGLPVTPGTYYLVASSTTPNFEVTINAEDMPCPAVEGFAFAPQPADNEDEVEPASVTLRWMIPEYATGWRLIFGTTYHPEAGHPQTIIYPEDGSFTRDMANSYTVRNLWNNTNYFWRVEFNNDGCTDGVSSPIWGFTTHLNIPQNLTVVDETVFNDETIVLNWNAVVDRTYRMYNVYRDGAFIGHTNVNNIGNTTYTDGPLAYNMDGYHYYVTAVYDEGESAPSNEVIVKVSSYGDVNGHVYEQDGTTGIANATVTMVGQDEFGVSHTYNFQTNAQGYYTGHIYAGAAYDGQAAKDGYQTSYAPVQGEPIVVNYNETASPYDYILDENFDPVCSVVAQYYPDSTDINAPYVKVFWGCGLPGEEIIEPFETGDFSQFDWQLDNNYPWSITTNQPYEGTYCMMSGGAGVASVTSNMTVTVDIPADGIMSFYGKISCESNWDYGYFFIDGVQKGSYTGQGNWGEKKFDITEGTHTFQWRYTKDSSVNSYDDCFYVDYINFYRRPEPPQPGWHTYLESDFDNAYRSNVGDPSWGYEYPTSVLSQFAGWNLTKVAVFSDDMYSAVGGNFTCNVYVGGSTPAAGTLASTITVDVPVGQGAWCEYDLTTPVNVTGTDPIWILWHVNSYGSSLGYPAGCASHSSQYGDWWNNGQDGWDHMDGATWTMKNFFTNRAGRTVALGTVDAVRPAAVTSNVNLSSNLRAYIKGQEDNTAECINPNATIVPMTSVNTNDRALSHYRVYRTNCYNDGPYTEENTVLLATVWVPDTVYIDVEWADLPAGVYKWGVGTVYAGNRGEEIAGPINWTEPVSVNNATREAFNYGFEGGLEGWTVLDAPGSEVSWVHSDNNPGGYDYTVLAHGGTGFAMGYSFVDYDGAYNIDSYLVSPQKYSIGDGSSISFWADNANDSYPESFSICVATAANPTIADFTTVWSGAAKGSTGIKAESRHDGNRYENWRSHSVDLSAYAGQEVWIAFHDVNYDAYEAWIDDVTINAGSGTGPTPPTPPTPGTGGLQLPRESEIVWSNCLDKDMYLGENEVDINVLLNSADNPEGITVSFTNLNEAEQELYPIADVVLDETGYYAWDTFRKGDYQLNITREGYEPIQENVSIWEPTSLRYVMIEIIYGVNDLYVSRTGWAMWEGHGDPSNPTPGPQPGNGDSFEFGFENGFEGWTNIDADGDGLTWVNSANSVSASGYDYSGYAHGGNYFVYSQSYIDYDGAYNANNYLVSPQKYSIVNGSTLTFWADNANDSYPDHFEICVATADNPGANDFTMVWSHSGAKGGDKVATRFAGNRAGNWRSHSVDLSAYAGQNVWIAFHHQDYDEYEIWIDDVTLTAGAKSGDRHLEYYKVMCESIDHEPIFNINTTHNFCQVATDELVEGEQYICKVAAVYSTGMSDYAECVWEYESCENYAGTVNGLDVNGTTVTWDYPGTPGPGPQPGNGDTFSVDFEAGIPSGWTTIDGGSPAGYGWHLGSTTLGTGYGHNGSDDLVISQSYDNNYGVIYPDNYLISPQVTIGGGATFSLWACGQDASYASEHFGVAISTTGTNASDFTMLNEWTIGSKGTRYDGNRGMRAQSAWTQYSVDLSNYAGQQVYLAVRHFNCSDMYFLDVDDLELTSGAKSNRAMWDRLGYINCSSAGQQAVATDGTYIYTGSWQATPTGGNRFYKYTMDGTFVEGFEISGMNSVQLRDLTFDGQYFYCGASSSTLYCLDLTNQTLIGTINTSCSAIRHCSYDPDRDGFWMGDWSTLALYDRNGALVQNGPAPTSAYGSGYYDGHLYLFCQPSSDAKVFDYDIAANTLTGPVCDMSSTPGYTTGIAGGAFVAQYGDKMAYFGNMQQEPNLISIYELGDAGVGPTPPPTPSGDVLGAMVFLNGEWEAFVPAPTNSYEFPSAGEYCVRIVYNGTADLPSNNFFYAMSCEECEGDTPGTCEPGDPIHAEAIGATDQVRIWWGIEPAAPINEWLYYDDGEMAGALGAGGAIYWAIMFPAASLQDFAGTNLTQVAVMEYDSPGNYTANIYLGGTSAPATLVSTQEFSATGTVDWKYVTLDTPVAIDGTQNLWITMYQAGITYPATACTNTGDPNGRWVSTNGTQWIDVTTAGDFNYTWLIRGFVTNQAKGGEVTALPEFVGEVGGELSSVQVTPVAPAFAPMNRAEIVKYNVYRSDDATGTYTQIGEVAEAGQTLYEYFDTPETAGTYFYQVTAVYSDGCESAPALAADDPTHNYVSAYVDAVGENSDNVALYPNPTKDNVTIEANGMSRITVVSVLGQVVFDTELNANVYTLNMSQFNAGMYMVRIYTENGVTVKRVTVMQ